MTERSLGAPDPVGDPPGGEETQQPAGTFWNLAAIRRSDDLVEALAARGPLPDTDPVDGVDAPDGEDPAARLLRALIADVDAGAPELPSRRADAEPSSTAGEESEPGGPRRGPRTIVALGIVGPLLTGLLTTGVAAAGGFIHRPGSTADADERPAPRGRAEARTHRDRVMPVPWRHAAPTSPAVSPKPTESKSPAARLRRHDPASQHPLPPDPPRAPVTTDRPTPTPEERTPVPGPEDTPAPVPSHDPGGRVPSPADPTDPPPVEDRPADPPTPVP